MKPKKFSDPKDMQIHETLTLAYNALKEKGYEPLCQLGLFVLTEDKIYITTHNNARNAMMELENEEILKHLLKYYFES